MTLNTLWELVDALDQDSKEISCLCLFVCLFSPQPSGLSSYLPPAKFHIVTASPLMLVTFVSGLWRNHLRTKLAATRLDPRTALLVSSLWLLFFPAAVGIGTHTYCLSLAFAGFFAVVFTSHRELAFQEEAEDFILPSFRKISLSHGVVMWLQCKDNHRKQTVSLIHHKSGVMWV